MLGMFMYFFMMLIMFLLMFIYSMYMYYMEMAIMLEWLMMGINSLSLEVVIIIDWISLLFISLIMLISSMIMLYSYIYMFDEINICRFIMLVNLFILSMILMVLSPSIISILFGWDGLGLVSYCLVIFYQNYSSFNSGMVTVLCNRIGDVGLLMAIGLLLFNGSWNLMFSIKCSNMVMFMLMIAAITKSAQIPFSMWLPMAMAAPTPVSALVHSSTLVTAGVYLMIRFSKFLLLSNINMVLYFLSVVTMFMAGFMANMEFDLKKIIALSTLSQLGLMMMTLSLGLSMISFFHLLTHAIFKSMLFMCAGVMIHLMMNNQDIRLFGNLKEIIPYIMMCFFIGNLSLCGLPFMSGFYSKDLIMEMVYSNKINLFMLSMMMMSLMFTVSYSLRLFYYMFFSNLKFYSYNNFKEDNLMNMSMMILVIFSIIMGSLMNWLFFFDVYVVYLKLSMKLVTLFVCLLGVMVGGIFISLNLIKLYYFSYFMGFMWFLNYSYVSFYKIVNLLGEEFYMIDNTWLEFSFKYMILNLIKKWMFNDIYKIYMFMMFFIYMCLMMILML